MLVDRGYLEAVEVRDEPAAVAAIAEPARKKARKKMSAKQSLKGESEIEDNGLDV
jgi:hypothetical protein